MGISISFFFALHAFSQLFDFAVALTCQSCDTYDECPELECTVPSDGYCLFQEIIDRNGLVVSRERMCLRHDQIDVEGMRSAAVGQCVTIPSETGIASRVLLCTTDYCNSKCDDDTKPTPVLEKNLICFDCDGYDKECFDFLCNVQNGYCLYQRYHYVLTGTKVTRITKTCTSDAVIKTPDGWSLGLTNKCIKSVDAAGNEFYAKICDKHNFCNDACDVESGVESISKTAFLWQTSLFICFLVTSV